MAEIALTMGKSALVDRADLKHLLSKLYVLAMIFYKRRVAAMWMRA